MENNQDNEIMDFQESQDLDSALKEDPLYQSQTEETGLSLTLSASEHSDDSHGDPDFDPEKAESPENSEKETEKPKTKSVRVKRAKARTAKAAGKKSKRCYCFINQTPKSKTKCPKACKLRANPKRSVVWSYFSFGQPDQRSECRIFCSQCGYSAKYTSSTSGMTYHLSHEHPHLYYATAVPAPQVPGHSVKESESARKVM